MHAQIPPLPCPNCGAVPHYKEREAQQAPYLGMYQAFIARIADMSPDVPIYQRDLNRWAAEIADERPDAAEDVGVNTTTYGREKETKAPVKKSLDDQIPKDFKEQWANKTRDELAKHYRRNGNTITRWCKLLGLKRGHAKIARTLRCIPHDFAKYGHLPIVTLTMRYACGHETIRRWRKATGIVGERVSFERPKTVSGDPVGARDYLQKYGPVSRCTSAGVMGGGSHWKRGSKVLTDEQLIEKAIELGWEPTAWKKLA